MRALHCVRLSVAAWVQRAADEEEAASGTSLEARIGELLESLAASGKKLEALMKEWDPNGDVS